MRPAEIRAAGTGGQSAGLPQRLGQRQEIDPGLWNDNDPPSPGQGTGAEVY